MKNGPINTALLRCGDGKEAEEEEQEGFPAARFPNNAHAPRGAPPLGSAYFCINSWCLLFVLIRQGLRFGGGGGVGPLRLIRELGREIGHSIMAFHS